MPSFDTVSEVDLAELNNAVDQAKRELSTRFDFRGVDANFERRENEVDIVAEADMQLDQLIDMLRSKLVNRSIDPKVMEIKDPVHRGKLLYQTVVIREVSTLT